MKYVLEVGKNMKNKLAIPIIEGLRNKVSEDMTEFILK